MSVHAATASIQLPGRPLIPNFGLLVGRYSLNEDLTTVLRIRRDEQTGARLHVELFLDYVKNYLVSETGLHERLRALPNLPDIIHIRFIRLTKPGTEDRPYRQMFFVCYKSSNEILQSVETGLSHSSSRMHRGGLMYVANPGEMPAVNTDYRPPFLVDYLLKMPASPFPREMIKTVFRQGAAPAVLDQTKRNDSSWKTTSSDRTLQSQAATSQGSRSSRSVAQRSEPVGQSRPTSPQADGGDNSDELVILDTISDPVSETFAIIIAKYFIAQDLRNSFINDSNKLYRFWKHIKDFFPSGFESPSVQMNDIHEIEVENKLIKMNDKTSREVFFVRSKGGDSASRQSKAITMRLKKHLRDKKRELERKGVIYLGKPGAIPDGNLYFPASRILDRIREGSTHSHSMPYDLLPKNFDNMPGNSPLEANKAHSFAARTSIKPHVSSSQQPNSSPLPSAGRPQTTNERRPRNSQVGIQAPPGLRPVKKPDIITISSSDDEPEIIDLTEDSPKRREVSLPEVPESQKILSPMKSAARSSDRTQSAPLSGLEVDHMDLDSPPESERPASAVSFPLSKATTDSASNRRMHVSVPSSPRMSAPPSISSEPEPITEVHQSVDISDKSRLFQQPSLSHESIGLYLPENEDTEEIFEQDLALKDVQEFLQADKSMDDASVKSAPDSPTSASEVATDFEEHDVMVSDDSAIGCTEWAKEMAENMPAPVARRYLIKARKYHRDELDSSFTDRMRDRPIEFQRSTYNRDIFESWILQSTLDEPNAPPISVKNTVDEEPCPDWEFFYTNKMVRGDGVPKPLPAEKKDGCKCIGGCYNDVNKCACAARQDKYIRGVREDITGFLYNDQGQLQELQLPVFECNDACSCADYCRNRVAQRGRQYAIDIRKTENRGWGVFAAEYIPTGSFIGLYSGELLLDAEAELRGAMFYDHYHRTYLFQIDSYYLREAKEAKGKKYRVKYTIDAMYAGCFTRFLNHACYPNCAIVPCLFGDADFEIPYLAFYSRIPIQKDDEITFSYKGYEEQTPEEEAAARKRAAAKSLFKKATKKNDADKSKIYVDCRCGSWNCNGSIWKTGSDDEEDVDSELDGRSYSTEESD